MRVLALVLAIASVACNNPRLAGSARISLARTACFGSCPDYSLEIGSDGAVTYIGNHYVVVAGRHTAVVDKDKARNLITRFLQSGFYGLKNEYHSNITDQPHTILTITAGGQSKAVKSDFYSMPGLMKDLASRMDMLVDVERWVKGNRETMSALRAEGFDFKSRTGGALLARAANMSPAEMVRELIEAGAPLDETANADGDVNFLPIGRPREVPLGNALWREGPEVLTMLVRAGASKNDPEVRADVRKRAEAKGWNEAAALLR